MVVTLRMHEDPAQTFYECGGLVVQCPNVDPSRVREVWVGNRTFVPRADLSQEKPPSGLLNPVPDPSVPDLSARRGFCLGDVVRLKSGGPKMVVVKGATADPYSLGYGSVQCCWNSGGEPQSHCYLPELLERVHDLED